MSQPAASEGTISIAEAARRLQASEPAVRHWLATGRLPCAHRLDSQGGVTECLILETDFLAFAQRSGMSPLMALEAMDTPPPALSAHDMTSVMTAAFKDTPVSLQAQPRFMPTSWRQVDTGLRLVWLISGLVILIAAALLAGWWPR